MFQRLGKGGISAKLKLFFSFVACGEEGENDKNYCRTEKVAEELFVVWYLALLSFKV